MIEALLIKPIGFFLVVSLPGILILNASPPWLRRILETEIWADPDR